MVEGTVVALPALLASAAYLVLARRAELRAATIVVGLAAIAHVSLLVALTLFPLPVQPQVIEDGRELQGPSNNLVPAAGIMGGIAQGRGSDVLKQALGNLLALAPLGLYGPYLWTALRAWRRVLVTGIAASVAVESAQLLTSLVIGHTYRVADVDDVFVNAAGVMAAYALYRVLTDANRRPSSGVYVT